MDQRPVDDYKYNTTEIEQNFRAKSDENNSLGINTYTSGFRRQLRTAVRDGDVALLQQLLQVCRTSGDGYIIDDVINESVSDAFSYSVLTLAVRCGHLHIVEALVSFPRCDIDRLGRTGLSALDEALAVWIGGTMFVRGVPTSVYSERRQQSSPAVGGNRVTELDVTDVMNEMSINGRHDNARRYRIVRCLLTAGASSVSLCTLDRQIAAAFKTVSGLSVIWSLVKTVCQKGCLQVRNVLLAILVWYPGSAAMLKLLLSSSACPSYVFLAAKRLISVKGHRPLPFDNAILLVRCSSDPRLLNFIECTTSAPLTNSNSVLGPTNMNGIDSSRYAPCMLSSSSWQEYRILIVLLTLSGHRIRLNVLDWLYKHHAMVYRWVVEHGGVRSALQRRPMSLKFASRLALRRRLRPNVIAALPDLAGVLPLPLRDFLLFNEVLQT